MGMAVANELQEQEQELESEAGPRRGERDAVRTALEEHRAQLELKLLNLLRESALRDVKPARLLREVQCLGDCREVS